MSPTAGYSGKPLITKLGIKPGHRLFIGNAPPRFRIEGLSADVVAVGPAARRVDVILFFVRDLSALRRGFARQAARLAPGGMLWVSWPKKASGVETDVTEDRVREVGLAAGLVDVKVCAVDAVWSGLKFVRRRGTRED